jgi:Uma2 family endonuclease
MPEMDRKRREYFDAGVDVVWLIDPESRTAAVYRRGQEAARNYQPSETIEETEVLPGFRLVLADLFAELDEQG